MEILLYLVYNKFKSMELQERINVLIQGAEIAQQKGALSLKEAYYAKIAVDALKSNTSVKEALKILVNVAAVGQKAGAYKLNDAALLYQATDNIDALFQQPQQPPVQQPVPTTAEPVQEKPVTTKKTKKESE